MRRSQIWVVIVFLSGSGLLAWVWNEKVEAERALSQARSELTETERRIARLQHDLEVSSNKLSECMEDLEATRGDMSLCAGELRDLRERTSALQAEVERLSASVEELEAARVQLEEANTQLEERRTMLEDAIGDMENRRRVETERMTEAFETITGAEALSTTLGTVLLILDRQGSILFEFDESDLTAESRELLGKICGVLLVSVGYNIKIHGHTDEIGTRDYNQGLSESRARAVRDYFESAGLPAERLAWQGHGEDSPLPGISDRALNRRVEIEITDSLVTYPSGPQGL